MNGQVWGIHGGKSGDADELFLKKNVVALGWPKVGDLSKIMPTRDAFKDKVRESYPERKEGAFPIQGGLLFRFVHEMKEGDLIIYPSKIGRQIHIGRVEGGYRFDPSSLSAYPNLRPVKWLKSFARTAFSQGALYEIGSAMSFFLVKSYAEEFVAALEGRPIAPSPAEDESVAPVAEGIEESTRDFILKTISKEFKGHPFAQLVGHVLEVIGYRAKVALEGPDGGIDIIAHKDPLGVEPPIIKVQVKSTDGSIGEPQVSALAGKIGTGEHGLFICLGPFTAQAKAYAAGRSNVRLMDGEDFVDLFLETYERLDSRYKGAIPLKQVYVPQQHADEE
jgi:restriction system protein